MPTFRVHRDKNYTVMSNHHLRNKNLSLKAIGLLSIMLSLPEDWDYSINGLVAICSAQKAAVRAALKEMEDNGYLVRNRVVGEHGHFHYTYDVYEIPVTEQGKNPKIEPVPQPEPAENADFSGIGENPPGSISPYTDFPYTVNPHAVEPYTVEPYAENQPQLNTNRQSTEQLNTKQLNKYGHAAKMRVPSPEEVAAYCLANGLSIDIGKFMAHNNAMNWRVGNVPVGDWRQCVDMWAESERARATSQIGSGEAMSQGGQANWPR